MTPSVRRPGARPGGGRTRVAQIGTGGSSGPGSVPAPGEDLTNRSGSTAMDSSDRHPIGIRPGGTSRDTEPASTGVPTVEQVADLLDELVEANGLLAAEVRLIIGSSAALSQTTVHRFSLLADRLAPGFRARVVLSELDPGLLLAGTSIWIARRRTRSGVSARAGARWSSGMSA